MHQYNNSDGVCNLFFSFNHQLKGGMIEYIIYFGASTINLKGEGRDRVGKIEYIIYFGLQPSALCDKIYNIS